MTLALLIYGSLSGMEHLIESTVQRIHTPALLKDLPQGMITYMQQLPRISQAEELDKAGCILTFIKLFSSCQPQAPWRSNIIY